MSLGSRIAIGLVALFSALGFWLSAQDTSDSLAGPMVFYGLMALCLVIAAACFFPKSHPVALRIIGASIFATYVHYVFNSWQSDDLLLAVKGFLFWGLPSGYLAIMGNYPLWGNGAAAFGQKPNK